MKINKRIIYFFTIILVLFYNPVSCYLFYQHTAIYGSKTLQVVFWAVPVLGILFLFYVRKNGLSTKAANVFLSFSFASMLVGIILSLNALVGVVTTGSKATNLKKNAGLIFEPGTSAHYKTTEFEFTADINSIGLRNAEITIPRRPGTFRVLCFGDSFTFGWGVEIENSWPMKLQKYLHDKGFTHVEVINCGQGGQYTGTYKGFIKKAVPLLKPDLVVVGVLQLDDLAQLYENNFLGEQHNTENAGGIKAHLKLFLQASVGNILNLVKPKNNDVVEVKTKWIAQSIGMMQQFSRLQNLRFKTLPDSVQLLFKSGDLNPGLLDGYINFPERNMVFNNPNLAATKFATAEMIKDFTEMKSTCDAYNAALVFVNLPVNIFTGHRVTRTSADQYSGYYQANNHIDAMYRDVAKASGTRYVELTEHFINLPDKDKYFFRFDGHTNAAGYDEIGNYLAGDSIILQSLQDNALH